MLHACYHPEQEEAYDRYAYDPQDLCIYVDDYYGVAVDASIK